MTLQPVKKWVRALVCSGLLILPGLAFSAPVIDVLVLYIDAAQKTQAGRDIDARIASYISYSNQAFANSNIDMRLRLVGSEKVNLDYTYVTEDNLAALRRNNEVARLRQRYGADLVTLINLRQPTAGGYVCGIAYVPPGNSRTGRFHSNASTAAFSLVGVNCGLSTFAHELGHNMGLGHSHVQNSEGGVWSWARGHGVQSLFSTIMAYPHSYGTHTQLQQFSNPQQTQCRGFACGSDTSRRDGADAATNLNALGSQVEAFMPAITATDNQGGQDNRQLPVCNKSEPQNNLIVDGEFNSLQHWTTLFDASQLSTAQVGRDCIDNLLVVGRRTQAHGNAVQNLGNRLQLGRDYNLSAKLGVLNISRDTVMIALRIEESGRFRYQYLPALSVAGSELSSYSESFRLDAAVQPDNIELLVYGPAPGVDILVDELTLTEVAPQVSADTEGGNRTVLHEEFEGVAQGWSSYGNSRSVFSTHADQGEYSLRTHSRTYNYSGPMREMTGLFEADTDYSISTRVFIDHPALRSAPVQIWVYYLDDNGEHWVEAANQRLPSNSWQTLTGEFSLQPVGEITQARLLIAGPGAEAELYIDDLSAVRQ